jgi:hypothetical protein
MKCLLRGTSSILKYNLSFAPKGLIEHISNLCPLSISPPGYLQCDKTGTSYVVLNISTIYVNVNFTTGLDARSRVLLVCQLHKTQQTVPKDVALTAMPCIFRK